MPDIGDIGKQNMDIADQMNVAAIRAKIATHRESAEWCEDCGAVIPEKRRLAVPGCTRCVRCQEKEERMQ